MAAATACFLGDNPDFAGDDTGTDTQTATTGTTDGTVGTSSPSGSGMTGESMTGPSTTTESTTATTSDPATSGSESGGTTGLVGGDAYANLVLSDEPVAYWRLGEEFGPEVVDQIGNYPGTYLGAIGFEEPGALANSDDTSVVFGGSGETKVDFGDVLDFEGRQAMTVEAWIRPTMSNEGGIPKIVSKFESNQGWMMAMNHNGTFSIDFIIWTDVPASDNDGVFGTVVVDQWQHIVATHDTVTLRLYVNAEEVSTRTISIDLPNGDHSLVLGSNPSIASNFHGPIDEVAIYDKALTPNQITAHYQTALGN